MFICEDCHTKRQARKAIESQPVQWTGGKCKLNTTCTDCGARVCNKPVYEYLNAYELVMELVEIKEKLDKIEDLPQFPINEFSSCQDMFDRAKIFPAILKDMEAMQQVLQYAGD